MPVSSGAGARQSADQSIDKVDTSAAGVRAEAVTGAACTPAVMTDVWQDRLITASHAAGPEAVSSVAADMIRAGIAAEVIAEVYIPEVARQLGEMWCDDSIGFAGVTVGVARLQGLLRELGPEWRADTSGTAKGPTMLVVVGADVSHTLGATVLTGQLRRRGISVRLMVGARAEDIGPLLRQLHFDAVMISAAQGESVEALRKLVAAVKQTATRPTPVIVGGTISGEGPRQASDLAALVGADYVTNDPDEALAHCRLTKAGRSGQHRARNN